MKIPLTKPYWDRQEEKAVIRSLRNGTGAGDGPESKRLAKLLKGITGAKYAFPVTSCTHGLELAMAVLNIGMGDEVILPSFTMTSTANCVVLQGATVVFADIEKDTYNIDPRDIERIITSKTRGIIVVHYAGMSCRMEEILKIAKKYKLFVVEDAAHAIGAKYTRVSRYINSGPAARVSQGYDTSSLGSPSLASPAYFQRYTRNLQNKGKALGTFGDIGVYSFHGTKNISCGEGGMVVTNNKELADRMAIFRANGTNRDKFLAGLVDKYSWVDAGSSYFLSDILAGIVAVQLGKLERINRERKRIAAYYNKLLKPFEKHIMLPQVPDHAVPNWHIYAIRFAKKEQAQVFMKQMHKSGIEVSSHYVPLHSSIAGRKYCVSRRELPVTDLVSQNLVRLPIYPGLSKKELEYIGRKASGLLKSLR